MFLYSNVSFILNSIHFHSFLAPFFLSLSKNVKDAAFLLKGRFYAAFTQTCVKAVETQVLRSCYAGLRKSCRNAAFTQVCVKAVETQLLRSFYAGLRKSCMQKLRKSRRYWHLRNCCVSAAFAHHDFSYEALRKSCRKAGYSAAFPQSCIKAS